MLRATATPAPGTFAVFARAADAIATAVSIQRRCASLNWPTAEPIRLRAAVHHGVTEYRQGDYLGMEVNRCARLCEIANPGTVLVSEPAAEAAPLEDGLVSADTVRLRDVAKPLRTFTIDPADVLGSPLRDGAGGFVTG